MADNLILAFKCLNPDCGQQIRLNRPAKSGVYAVTCPHCHTKKQLRLKGMDAYVGTSTSETGGDSSQSTMPKTPDNSSKPSKEMAEDFVVDEAYSFKCPHCNKQEIGFKTDKPGHRTISCPYCKGKIGLDIRPKTVPVTLSEQLQLYRGKLTLLRKGWLNKDYRLSDGKNIIGRYDESSMCDIAIKNDSSMSRRSVEIDVMKTEKGYTFKLTVLKATNPVLHNGNPLMAGESVSLNFGDSILMGKTKFRFDKDI